ncbi:MAG: HAMP domain-containing histidine kinase [Ruminococcus flavefaciens]|nr:HAMP domain-containing histidine kinase [Ruminococcus flavefaciens]
MKKSAREIKEKIAERMSADTNTLIDISSSDRDIRALAESLNVQLQQLRQEKLRYQQGDTELKEAVTNISHDLRTPLTAISGYLDLLEKEKTSDTVRKYITQIVNRTDAMKQLTEELFRYSIVASVREMNMEPICLNSILEESIASYYGAIIQHGITPNVEISESPVERTLDKYALMRIFGNIISNTLKYSDGDLSVKLTENGMITFSNTAKNLNAVTVGRLFDRFYTVETAKNSTGLGLSIAKLFTEQMGGTIKAEYANESLVITIYFK